MKRTKTPSFLLELPLQVDWSTEKPLRAHLEAARCLSNALLSEANKRLRAMRHDPAWQAARALPRTKKRERAQAFSAVRKPYHFSEYDLHEYAKRARTAWIADHIDSTMAQTLATRAHHAVNRVCVGRARRVRFRSRGRGTLAKALDFAHQGCLERVWPAELQTLAASCAKSPLFRPDARTIAITVVAMRRSRDRNAGITAPVDVDRCNAICTRASCWPFLNLNRNTPLSLSLTGQERNRA